MSEESDDQKPHIPLARKVVLPYQGALATSATTIRKFHDLLEAQLFANELASHDIEYFLVNQNVTGLGFPYSGFSQIELQVREQDLAESQRILTNVQVNPLELEPEDTGDPKIPIPDPGGEGVLVMACAYENPRDLFDAAASLGAARIEAFVPSIVPRRDRPAGEGKRFVLRVREEDLERAVEILNDAESERAENDEPRCPKCGSYHVAAPSRPLGKLMKFLIGFGPLPPSEAECLRCKHRFGVDTPT